MRKFNTFITEENFKRLQEAKKFKRDNGYSHLRLYEYLNWGIKKGIDKLFKQMEVDGE